jgi:alginate O-acetyltransferase complex protein AlgI
LTFEVFQMLVAGLACVAVFWALPRRHAQSGVAVVSLLVLLLLYPGTAFYLVASVLAVHGLMRWRDRIYLRGTYALLASICLGAMFLVLRDPPGNFMEALPLIGAAYFTLRHIHVLAEWAWGRLAAPSLPALLRYHLMLPVMMSGPIHRFAHFNRECQRRRWGAEEFFTGAERVLLGVVLLMFVGDFALGWRLDAVLERLGDGGLIQVWIRSAIDWIRLYVYFSGYTDIALGLSLMMGLKLEENFNKPWCARSLVDFWTRWHMTLSHWCRDYVYVPVAAVTRSPVLGVAVALLVLGIWHQTSVYYVAWAIWQTTGIVLTHIYGRFGDPLRIQHWPEAVVAVAAPVAILAWLSAAKPTISFLLGSPMP